ncbi:MAG: hypothetical protein SFU98_04120 [Leptospiraceae bacterium]|nr:hypothetical protein [Leptospiraceae bacterium]
MFTNSSKLRIKIQINFRQILCSVLITGTFIGCTSQREIKHLAIQEEFKPYANKPEQVGKLIYIGDVYPLGLINAEQAFTYERRVKEIEGGLLATHITRDAGRNIIVVQIAKYSSNYELKEFESIHKQTGITAKMKIEGNKIQYIVKDSFGTLSTSEEEILEPIAVGPTLFGMISSHWDELEKGSEFILRFAVAEEKQTYRFSVKKILSNKTIARFEMKATNPIIGLFISPFIFEYDTEKRTILTYKGRVPPMRTIDGKLQALDAKVFYTYFSSYR